MLTLDICVQYKNTNGMDWMSKEDPNNFPNASIIVHLMKAN